MRVFRDREKRRAKSERASERENLVVCVRLIIRRAYLCLSNTEIRFVCRFVTRERRSQKSSSFEAGKGLFVLRISDDAFACCFF